MCLKSRQNKGRIKGSLDLIVSLKTEMWIFLVTPSGFSVPGGFNRWWRTGPFSGEGFSDTGTRASEPPGRTEIATRASGNETGTPAHCHSSPVLLQVTAGSGFFLKHTSNCGFIWLMQVQMLFGRMLALFLTSHSSLFPEFR